jgi:putative endonuclease
LLQIRPIVGAFLGEIFFCVEALEQRIMREQGGFVYILASKRNGTLYTGVTNNLARRIWEHKEDLASKFTTKYHVKVLVWFEFHEFIENAIQRETSIKRWKRKWKLDLIESRNPDWRDLYGTFDL